MDRIAVRTLMSAEEVIFHRLAAKEYRAALRRYNKRSPTVANQFCASVDLAVNTIRNRCDALPKLIADYRYVRVGRFPYVLIFRNIDANYIKVVAVAHTSRRTGYWLRRT